MCELATTQATSLRSKERNVHSSHFRNLTEEQIFILVPSKIILLAYMFHILETLKLRMCRLESYESEKKGAKTNADENGIVDSSFLDPVHSSP